MAAGQAGQSEQGESEEIDLTRPIKFLAPENKSPDTYVTVSQFKGGITTFKFQFEVFGPLEELDFSTQPGDLDITVNPGGAKGKGIKVKVEEGKKYDITIQVPLK